MKLLLDAQLSHLIAEELERRHHDVDAVTSRADIPDNTPDDQVLALAANEDRVVVTNNIKDFVPLAAQRINNGSGHAGLILIAATVPRTKASAGPLADALEQKIHEYPNGLANNQAWISKA